MIRGLWIFAQLTVLVLAAVWLADQKGAVSILWRGWLIETSVGVLAPIVLLISVVIVLLWRLWRGLRGTPHAISRFRLRRRRDSGRVAMIRSLSAIAAGDGTLALKHLAAAEAAELAGDIPRAKLEYGKLRDRPDTALIGLKGLIGLTESEGDFALALTLTRKARTVAPKSPWAARHQFELEQRTGAYAEAERTLADAVRLGAFSAAEGDRQSARLLLTRGREAEAQGNDTEALGFAERAHKQDAALAEATLLGVRLLARSGRTPAAERMLSQGWAAAPDVALARAWLDLAPRSDATARIRQAERLQALDRGNPIARLVLAEAELAARRWAEARNHLAALEDSMREGDAYPRYCQLMAYLESESGNPTGAQNWLKRSLAPEDGRKALSSAA